MDIAVVLKVEVSKNIVQNNVLPHSKLIRCTVCYIGLRASLSPHDIALSIKASMISRIKQKGFSIGRELVSLLVAVKLLNDYCVLNYQTICIHFYKVIHISCVTQVYMPKVCMDAG